MIGAHPAGYYPAGNYDAIRVFPAQVGASQSRGVLVAASVGALEGASQAVGIVTTAKYFVIAEQGKSEAVGVAASVSVVPKRGLSTSKGVGAGLKARLPASGTSEAVGVQATAKYFVVPDPGKSAAKGVKTGLRVGVLVATSKAVGSQAGADYVMGGQPDIYVAKDGTNAIISLKNPDGRDVKIKKSSDWHPAYSVLGTFTQAEFPLTVDISNDPNPRFQAAWTVDGNIDGSPVSPQGRFTRRKLVRKDG